MVSTLKNPFGSESRVLLRNVSWQGYQDILHALPATRSAKLAYDQGTLEIAEANFRQWVRRVIHADAQASANAGQQSYNDSDEF
jgi:hypothetical protein